MSPAVVDTPNGQLSLLSFFSRSGKVASTHHMDACGLVSVTEYSSSTTTDLNSSLGALIGKGGEPRGFSLEDLAEANFDEQRSMSRAVAYLQKRSSRKPSIDEELAADEALEDAGLCQNHRVAMNDFSASELNFHSNSDALRRLRDRRFVDSPIVCYESEGELEDDLASFGSIHPVGESKGQPAGQTSDQMLQSFDRLPQQFHPYWICSSAVMQAYRVPSQLSTLQTSQ